MRRTASQYPRFRLGVPVPAKSGRRSGDNHELRKNTVAIIRNHFVRIPTTGRKTLLSNSKNSCMPAGVDDEGISSRVAGLCVFLQPPRTAPAGQASRERHGLHLQLQRDALVGRPGKHTNDRDLRVGPVRIPCATTAVCETNTSALFCTCQPFNRRACTIETDCMGSFCHSTHSLGLQSM